MNAFYPYSWYTSNVLLILRPANIQWTWDLSYFDTNECSELERKGCSVAFMDSQYYADSFYRADPNKSIL